MTDQVPSESRATPVRGDVARRVTRWVRLLAMFGFILPFLTVSCMGQDVVSPSGVELAFGLDTEVSPEFDELVDETGGIATEVEPEVLIALALTAGAAVFGFGRAWKVATLLSLGAAGVLLYWWTQVVADIPGEVALLVDVSIGIGLWMVWIMLLTSTGIDIFANVRDLIQEQVT